jgi:hypothetical protein
MCSFSLVRQVVDHSGRKFPTSSHLCLEVTRNNSLSQGVPTFFPRAKNSFALALDAGAKKYPLTPFLKSYSPIQVF